MLRKAVEWSLAKVVPLWAGKSHGEPIKALAGANPEYHTTEAVQDILWLKKEV
ncbi:hypothetical protein M1N57_00090 [Dehalococcoidales bacterium]|nr:hypothetical protein [Dehalococcoidales bacterium]